ncbi:MAG TPA: hypothetical protein VH684_19390 [Xanthobacteraceae bacterium]|jgi:hypothetical protein
MTNRSLSGLSAGVLAAALIVLTMAPGKAADDAKYPNWKGQWVTINFRLGGQVIKYDPNKAWGPAQQAPLTPEYQKILEESMADQAEGGLGNYPTARCLPGGMPRVMAAPTQEYIVTPETTYISTGQEFRRIFTDGRDWPAVIEQPTFQGYSIGRWVDEDGDGRYDTLEADTRVFKGPRAFDASGLPLAFDNQSIFRERFHLDKANPNLLHDEITTIDHALTRPWSVDKTFRRSSNPRPDWGQRFCTEGNNQVMIGNENYFLSADGLLMPAKRDQAPPDLRYFKRTQR